MEGVIRHTAFVLLVTVTLIAAICSEIHPGWGIIAGLVLVGDIAYWVWEHWAFPTPANCFGPRPEFPASCGGTSHGRYSAPTC